MHDKTHEKIRLAAMNGLNARCIGVLGGPGSGKTTSLAELHTAPGISVLSFDPAGALAKRVEQLRDVDVLTIPTDWEDRPDLIPWICREMHNGGRVCCDLSARYQLAPDFIDETVGQLREEKPEDLLVIWEEAQRYLGQNRGDYSYSSLDAVEQGRNWQWGRAIASQRPADVDKRVLERCDTLLLGRIQGARDASAYEKLLKLNISDRDTRDEVLQEMLDLAPGEVLLREPENPPGVNQ